MSGRGHTTRRQFQAGRIRTDFRSERDYVEGFDELVLGDWFHMEALDDHTYFVSMCGRRFIVALKHGHVYLVGETPAPLNELAAYDDGSPSYLSRDLAALGTKRRGPKPKEARP